MSQVKKAFITGLSGQDGSYLAEFLLNKNYIVGGMIRRSSAHDLENIAPIKKDLNLFFGDITSAESVAKALETLKPDEIYNLASLSSPLASFQDKVGTLLVNGMGAVQLFEQALAIVPKARIYQASTSDMFGKPGKDMTTEETPFNPTNPYSAAKAYAHRMAMIARQDKNHPQFISCGILFNHESPRRGLSFVTRKITSAVACLKNQIPESKVPISEFGTPIIKDGKLRLGNLRAVRDWGYAPDYVEAMWRMLQHDVPEDFVIATGQAHSVEDFAREAFSVVGLDYKQFVETDPLFVPPVDTFPARGDYSKAKKLLGWEPRTEFRDIIRQMVESDLKRFIN